MVTKTKKTQTEQTKVVATGKKVCADQFCPFHGRNAVKLRTKSFEGEVIKKLPGRVKIEFERFLYDRKYERFDKRRTRLHARLPDCLNDQINIGDWIEITECRPLSKIIHFIAVKKIRSKTDKIANTDVGLQLKSENKK